ncbi:hypothetical protein JR552_001752 [Listeria monocytogenes serotype 1/2b]|uniref:hypothetical protein n=1 Tax=Listeria seeligeri TaxID=1640 RepID=UPI0022EBC524|nr:hypothetical protein [Listeria seeligeri]EHC6275895.1 hypothetical protein [Listeria monocytogenes serotype 1/2b]EJR2826471.1 hypothetical protein [Listeria monocytogenes]
MNYKQFYAFDEDGNYTESVLVFENEKGQLIQPGNTTEVEPVTVENEISRAMFYPKWTGKKWTEDKKKWLKEHPPLEQEKTEIEIMKEELAATKETIAALVENNNLEVPEAE